MRLRPTPEFALLGTPRSRITRPPCITLGVVHGEGVPVGTKMVSLRLDEGLLEWATGYARERGVSRTGVVEAALRGFREDCARGVPDLEDERVPRPTPPPSVVPPVKRLSRSKHSELAMARMRRMDPRRYG
jgi:hypothetical protein